MTLRQICSVVASVSLLGFSAALFSPGLVTSPIAAAQEPASTHRTVTSGTMDWGVRESFRKYIETGVAKGTITTGGGATRPGGAFSFPVESSAITSASVGQLNFKGEVNFTGHNGALDITFKNPILVVNNTQAELRVDYASRKYEGVNATGAMRTGQQEVLATVALSSAPNFAAAQTTLSGAVTLTSSGAEIFGGFYETGEELDPINIRLSLTDASGAAPTPQFTLGSGGAGTGTGATRSNATSGPAYLLGKVNDTLVEVNGLFVNTESILRSGENLHNRVLPNQQTGTTSTGTGASAKTTNSANTANTGSRTSAANTGTTNTGSGGGSGTTNTASGGGSGTTNTGSGGGSGTTNTGSGGGSGTTNQAQRAGGTNPGTSGAAAGGGSIGGVCEGNASRGVVSAEAQWGIRQSFRTYIRGNIAKGSWELKGVGDNGSTFTFNGDSGAVDTAARTGSILFPGSIRFTGHGGVLDTRFSNMEIQFNGDAGKIVLNASSNSTDGTPNDFGRVAIANLSFTNLDVSDSTVAGTAQASLTEAGAEAFGQFYPPGDPLDPISFSAQLGGSANCVEGQGGSSSAGLTGKGGSAADAAALRSGGASTTAQTKLQSGGGSASATTSGSGGSVFDDLDDAETIESAGQPEGGQFKIKNMATGAEGAGGWDDSAVAKLLLLLASLIGAGGALTRFIATA
ncbi:HtaA domain-containing protein [Corynebacterium sp. Marseille-P4321]|uniref:HtaA domain-containing protein n=1 Tax=Corynebacterium sp. Marseille-P4321 TaxID=2736603 RepID=UPI00158B665B|nr:HtaA domain-containing protein [Corynebacterium sp. Marseille-P4321]